MNPASTKGAPGLCLPCGGRSACSYRYSRLRTEGFGKRTDAYNVLFNTTGSDSLNTATGCASLFSSCCPLLFKEVEKPKSPVSLCFFLKSLNLLLFNLHIPRCLTFCVLFSNVCSFTSIEQTYASAVEQIMDATHVLYAACLACAVPRHAA